ncbi:ClpP/crotonase-like domain-containing protein [Protomyces lactucae-debilis]|uniref:ClpP/crotonase-like domain-containing protein n=1 Tax=Protomyces lactucae-debilis TaxID=2754530 RepID=A0A1Y2FHU8_PROLT|nr:ClpP/crotonase-like domain-containing protein [Protomyces lactucae-debilis]ORY83177.1 ClpP/crotonase-like domain-containing protein [Protomyces lactucae-debilis]
MQPIKFPNEQDAKVILTQPEEGIFLITFCNGEDNRLVTDFCQGVLSALDKIEQLCPVGSVGAVVTTGSVAKFYSNGLDLDHAGNTEGFWERSFYPMLHRLASYHLPCVAAINGHAFAGGAMMALCHDYRITNASKGFMSLNEVHFGAPLMTGMMACVRHRVSPAAVRKCVLEGHRFAGAEQVKLGFADQAADPADNGVLKAAIKEAQRLSQFSKTGVYGKLKLEMNAALLATLNIQSHNACVERMAKYDDDRDAFQESKAKL